MEFDLQSLFGLLCTAVLIGRDPATPPSPRIWCHIRGRYWSAKIDDFSLKPPATEYTAECQAFSPVVRIGYPRPLSRKRVVPPPLPPPFGSKGGGTHSLVF
jgi:hypothetical protein